MFNLSAFLSYVFVVTFTPGPNNIMSMVNASKYGYKKNLRFTSGIFTGFFLIMILSSYGNLLLFNIMPKIKVFMGILGAGYMVYLALKIMKSSKKTNDQNDKESIPDNERHEDTKDLTLYLTGITMQFVNPKVILYGITVISNFIIPFYKSNIALILFSVFFAFVSFTSTSCWALFGSLFKRFLSKYQKPFNIIMGLLLIYSAISISGITHLFNK